MVKKQSKDLKKGDNINLTGKRCIVENFEISEIGKQGKRKVRLELKTENGEKIIIIRPEDYPMEVE